MSTTIWRCYLSFIAVGTWFYLDGGISYWPYLIFGTTGMVVYGLACRERLENRYRVLFAYLFVTSILSVSLLMCRQVNELDVVALGQHSWGDVFVLKLGCCLFSMIYTLLV